MFLLFITVGMGFGNASGGGTPADVSTLPTTGAGA
jgi:hypothetical protein